jgi:predicted nucleotidyltransferase
MPAADARAVAERAAKLLAADPRVELVYLFGSGADPTATTVEDLDIAVQTAPALDDDGLMRRRADLVTDLQAPIDLVSLNRASIVLAHEIAEHGRCLFARTPEMETEFVVRARARYWDFRPLLETQWRHAGQRLQERRRGA